MPGHNIQTLIESGEFTTSYIGPNVPGYGRTFGFGTTTPTTEGWAAGALFQVLGATAALYMNTGTSTTAVWTAVIHESGQEDFGAAGIKTDVVSESTSATGVTIDGVLLKDAAVQSGASGTAGSLTIFPTTASKGKLVVTCADQTGDTQVSLVVGAMAAARTVTLRDPGAAASFLTTTDATAAATTSTAVELTRAASVGTRSIAAGSALAVTEATHESRTILLDTATGSVCTLPAPTEGLRFRFIVTVKPTSNFHQIKVAAATDFLAGSVNILDADGAAQGAYAADGTADDNIQLNGTTTGGQVGDWLEFECISTTQWAVKGNLVVPTGSNPADPFSAAV